MAGGHGAGMTKVGKLPHISSLSTNRQAELDPEPVKEREIMNKFEESILDYLGEENFKKVQAAKIGIAGCGGLGSNCAFNLVRSGIKNLTLVDFDTVDIKNINRQFYFLDQVGEIKVEALKENLLKINPGINLKIFNEKLDRKNIAQIFSECDVVVEAFDKSEYKKIIVEEVSAIGKFLVSASGLAGIGKSDDIRIKKVNDNFYIVGDMTSDVKERPPFSPRVNIAAAKQADIVLEWILGST